MPDPTNFDLEPTFRCPECGGEMIPSPLDSSFPVHVESTDCAPNPWPTIQPTDTDTTT